MYRIAQTLSLIPSTSEIGGNVKKNVGSKAKVQSSVDQFYFE